MKRHPSSDVQALLYQKVFKCAQSFYKHHIHVRLVLNGAASMATARCYSFLGHWGNRKSYSWKSQTISKFLLFWLIQARFKVAIWMKTKPGTLHAHRQSALNYIPTHHTWRSLSLPRLSEVRKKEEPPPLLVTNPEQRAILFTCLLKDCLQSPAGTTMRNAGRCSFILGLVEVLVNLKIYCKLSRYLLLVGDL